MENRVVLYYFSPTGGTKKVGEYFCEALGKDVESVNLGEKTAEIAQPTGELVVVAAPVFGGRIPALVSKKISKLNGEGINAVGIVVYGNRAYEDALLELKDTLEERSFNVIGAGALVAKHSMVPEVGQGRPDDMDQMEICKFAKKVLENVEKNSDCKLEVPGNKPYKAEMSKPISPISLDSCNKCGKCKNVCPTDAISQNDNVMVTDVEKCILCMACVAACPKHTRILPPPVADQMNQKLGALKEVRGKNEFFM